MELSKELETPQNELLVLRNRLLGMTAVVLELAQTESLAKGKADILKAIRLTFQTAACDLWLIDQTSRVLHLEEFVAADSEVSAKFKEKNSDCIIALGEGLHGRAWQTRTPHSRDFRDAENDRWHLTSRTDAPHIATAAIPLLAGDKVLGVIGLYDHRRIPDDDSEQSVMASVGSLIGNFIHSKHAEVPPVERAEALLAAIVDASEDAIISVAIDGRISSWNAGASAMFGYQAAEVVGQPISMLYPSDNINEVRILLDRIFRGERLEHHETVRVHKEGHRIDISLVVSPIRDQSGAIVGASKVYQNIARRKRAESALRDSEERFHAIALNAPVALYIKDLEGRYTLANPLACEALGRPQGVDGLSDHDLLPSAVADRLRDRDLEVISTGRIVETEEVVERDGFHKDYLSVKFPLLDSTGKTVGVCGVSTDITQRRIAQEALRESEERFARFMHHLPGLAWIKDTTGRYVFANEAAMRSFQTSPANLYGKNDAEVFAPDTANQFAENDRQALASDTGIHVVETLRHQDGVVHYSVVNKFPIPGREGIPTLVGGMAIDITELKQAEEALHHSEERFRALASQAPVGIFMSAPNGDNVFVNNSWSAMSGLTMEQARGQGWENAIHPDDRERVVANWNSAVERGIESNADFRFLRPDGTVTWLQGNAVPLRDAHANLVGYIGTLVDITERRRVEQRSRSLAEASAILAGSLDHEATLTAIAQLLVPSLGDWCAIELLGDNNQIEHVTVSHSDPQKVDLALELRSQYLQRMDSTCAGVARVIRTGQAELLAKTADEQLRQPAGDDEYSILFRELGMESGLMVPLVARGRSLGAITLVAAESGRRYDEGDLELVQDLASRCALAVDNAMLYQDAQHELAERRRAEENLRVAREAAEAANRSKSEFLTNMSHEIRTPMSAILGYADLLSRDLHEPEHLSFVDTIRRNGDYLLDILNDVLDLSRIEAGRMEIDRHRFSPHKLFLDVYHLMKVRADQKHLSLRLDFEGPIPETIESDPLRLRQIVINLVGNSIKFTESGSVRIVVRFIEDVPLLCFDVVDTGIGLSKEQLGRLFEPFTQADSSVTRRYGGSGVGLNLCRRLTEILGGRIEVQSELGKGTLVSVAIATGPLHGVALLQTQMQESVMQDEPIAHPVQLHCRVLIVEDQVDVRRLIERSIAETGGDTVLAANGLEALKAVDRARLCGWPIEVIVMDMQMPVMDGYQTALQLRANGFNAPIIAVTAHAMQGDREKCLNAGCNEYVSKPIDFSELIRCIRQQVETVRSQNSSRRQAIRAVPQADAKSSKALLPLRVLLVEDDEQVCRLMCMQLESSGHEVRWATSGSKAIASALDFQPDVIVLDLGLPDMSGFEVVSQLKGMSELRSTVWIALSGRGDDKSRRLTTEAGFHHHLVKPAGIEQLEELFPRAR